MTLYITPDNKIHDDEEGRAKTLPSWPQDARIATQEEIDAIHNPPKTLEQVSQEFENGIQAYLDAEAQSKGYDNILSACTYAYPDNPFQEEATSFVIWRSSVWAYCYQELAKVKSGMRPIPTIQEIITELPPRASA